MPKLQVEDETPECLPCPFCGAPDPNLKIERCNEDHWIECVDCGAHGPTQSGASSRMAARLWNHRDGKEKQA